MSCGIPLLLTHTDKQTAALDISKLPFQLQRLTSPTQKANIYFLIAVDNIR